MTEDKSTLEEAINHYQYNDYRQYSTEPSFMKIILEAARKYAGIKALVDAGSHALVPVEPTEVMKITGQAAECNIELSRRATHYSSKEIYQAMLKAAPKNDLP